MKLDPSDTKESQALEAIAAFLSYPQVVFQISRKRYFRSGA